MICTRWTCFFSAFEQLSYSKVKHVCTKIYKNCSIKNFSELVLTRRYKKNRVLYKMKLRIEMGNMSERHQPDKEQTTTKGHQCVLAQGEFPHPEKVLA